MHTSAYTRRLTSMELLLTMQATGCEVAAVARAARRVLEYEYWVDYVRRSEREEYKGRTADEELNVSLPWVGEKRRRQLLSAVVQRAYELRGGRWMDVAA